MTKEKVEIKNFVENLKVDKNVTSEQSREELKSAYMDRSREVYFIWKKLKELYPDVDANKVVGEGCWDFGLYIGEQIAKKYGTTNLGPKEALLGQTSRGGWLVFQQEILELNDNKAVKIFKACPHMEALKELGLNKEEIKEFCRDILGRTDYAICASFKNVKIDFPTTIGDGEGYPCVMKITKVKNKK